MLKIVIFRQKKIKMCKNVNFKKHIFAIHNAVLICVLYTVLFLNYVIVVMYFKVFMYVPQRFDFGKFFAR